MKKRFLAIFLVFVLIFAYAAPIRSCAEDDAVIEAVSEPDPEVTTNPPVTEATTEPSPVTEPTEATESTEPTEPTEPPVVFEERTVFGSVVDEAGAPIPGVTVTFTAEDMDTVTAETGNDGSFEAVLLTPAEWTVVFDGGADYKTATLIWNQPNEGNLGTIRLDYVRYSVRFVVENASAEYTASGVSEGEGVIETETELSFRRGTTLTVTAQENEGCDLATFEVSGPAYAKEEKTITIESLTENAEINVIANDVTAPVFGEITMEEGWAQSKTVRIEVTDNVTAAANIALYVSENEYDTASGVESFAERLPDAQYLAVYNGVRYVYAIDEAGNLASSSFTVSQIDTEAPVVSELIPSTLAGTHELTYGFTVTDNGELDSVTWTDLEGTVTVLDPNDDGAYAFTVAENGDYVVTATDMAGNVTTSTITASNIDWTEPELQVVTQESWDQEHNVTRIAVTDASEIVRVWVVDEEENETDLEPADGVYVFDTSINGSYTVHALDEAGNESEAGFAVDHIDTEAPVISHIEKDPTDEWTARSVIFTVETADAQSGIAKLYYFVVDGEAAPETLEDWSCMEAEDGQTEFEVTVPNSKDLVSTILFVVEDGVGRVSDRSEANFAIDISAPEQVVVDYDMTPEGGYFKTLYNMIQTALLYRDRMDVRVSAADLGAGIDRYEYQIVREGEEVDEDAWKPMDTEETEDGDCGYVRVEEDDFRGHVFVRVYDKVGNVVEVTIDPEDKEAVMVVLENTPANDGARSPAPVLTAVTDDGAAYSEGSWTNKTVYVSAKAVPAISGIARYEYQIVAHGASTAANKWRTADAAKVAVSTDSNVDVYFRAVSYAENPSRTSHVTVRVQKTPPQNAEIRVTGTEGDNGWFTSLPMITIVQPVPKANQAPITTWYNLRSKGGEGSARVLGNSHPEIRVDGVYELTVFTVDAAGNRSGYKTEEIFVDTTAPVNLSMRISGESILAQRQDAVSFRFIYNRSVTVTAGAEAAVSGLASLQYQKVYGAADYNPSGPWTAWPGSGLRIDPDDNCVIYLKATDKAGNFTVVHSDGLIMDNTPPSGPNAADLEITVTGANGNNFFSGNGAAVISIIDPARHDAYSGLATVTYQVITDGRVTQNESINIGENGTDIRQTELVRGNNSAVWKWSGRLTVHADQNNSDNIVIRVTAADRAGNSKTTETKPGAMKIDTTAPTAEIGYDNNNAAVTSGNYYFKDDRTITIKVRERDLGSNSLKVTRNGENYPVILTWSKTAGVLQNGDDSVFTASATFSEDGVYKLSFEAADLAGNAVSSVSYAPGTTAPYAFILDKTAPTITVTYDNNTAQNDKFFDAPRTATITVTDANFHESMFRAGVTAKTCADGKSFDAPKLSEWSHNGNVHTATIAYEKDGDYTFEASVTDLAGNRSSAAAYPGAVAPTDFTVDTVPVEVKVDGLDKNRAYNGDLTPVVLYRDVNMANYDLTLTVTNLDIVDKDVTKDLVTLEMNGSIRIKFPENTDGIYVLRYAFRDKAGHETSDSYKFTVNRNGSVFEYSQDLLKLLNSYVYDASGDYRITEYNPTPVDKRSVVITVDGAPMATPNWSVNPVSEDGAGWYQYEYTISDRNFVQDGQYRVTVATKDGADNRSEATPDILFWRDTKAPEIQLVTGLEDSIVNASSQDVGIRIFDTIGLAHILVTVKDDDGNEKTLLDEDVEEGVTELEKTVTLGEGLRQHVRIVLEDRAGNVIDSDAENYKPAFEFADEVTVSENFFTRWYANPWVFFGSIGGFGALASTGVVGILAAKKRKKEEKEN